jgi:branched-chain amino acid transport system ATP-binding protein
MSDFQLEVQRIGRHFGGLRALHEVSFVVRPGQICSVIGPNGAGKSTLLNILSGVTPASAGTITLGGRRLDRLAPHRRVVAGIARTFQNLQLFEELTVLENVMIGAHTRSRSGFVAGLLGSPGARRDTASARRSALQLLDRLGLTERAQAPAQSLSYGDAKIMEIARAMASEPRILLLDEPLAGLSGDAVERVSQVVKDLNRAGTSIVLVEHNVRVVMQLSDQVVVLSNGELISQGTAQQVQIDPVVIEAYLGEPADGA